MGELIKTYVSADRNRRIDFYRRDDGYFLFDETYRVEEFDERYEGDHSVFWLSATRSGLFAELERAETEALATIAWLRSALKQE